jgi:hypothetical protein
MYTSAKLVNEIKDLREKKFCAGLNLIEFRCILMVMQANLTRQKDERMGHVQTCSVLLLCAIVGVGLSLQVDGVLLQFIVGFVGTALCFCALGKTLDDLPGANSIGFSVLGAKTVPIFGEFESRQVRAFRPPRHLPNF